MEESRQNLSEQKAAIKSSKTVTDQLIARRLARRMEEGKKNPIPKLESMPVRSGIDLSAASAVSNKISTLFQKTKLV